MRRDGVTYALHHIGIPTSIQRANERHAFKFGMYTSDDLTGPLPIQWHRFDADSPLPWLLRTQPHVAYKVSNLQSAIVDHVVILGPYEPIQGFRVAVIDNSGMPIELIETDLPDEVIWERARRGQKSSLYE
jgi:hypothetical protein